MNKGWIERRWIKNIILHLPLFLKIETLLKVNSLVILFVHNLIYPSKKDESTFEGWMQVWILYFNYKGLNKSRVWNVIFKKALDIIIWEKTWNSFKEVTTLIKQFKKKNLPSPKLFHKSSPTHMIWALGLIDKAGATHSICVNSSSLAFWFIASSSTSASRRAHSCTSFMLRKIVFIRSSLSLSLVLILNLEQHVWNRCMKTCLSMFRSVKCWFCSMMSSLNLK